MPLSRLMIHRGRQMGEQQKKISCSITIRQSWPLVSLIFFSLAMHLSREMVTDFMTMILYYSTKAHGTTKYAYVILLYLAKIEAILSESDAHDLEWKTPFNKHGLPGMNIPVDLQTEQFNHDVKSMWKSLAANINGDSVARIANTVESMEVIPAML